MIIDWQPFDTAPKDGKTFLASGHLKSSDGNPIPFAQMMYWDAKKEAWEPALPSFTPTHWSRSFKKDAP